MRSRTTQDVVVLLQRAVAVAQVTQFSSLPVGEARVAPPWTSPAFTQFVTHDSLIRHPSRQTHRSPGRRKVTCKA